MSDAYLTDAFSVASTTLEEMGIDIAEGATDPMIGAFAAMFIRIEESKLDETYGEEPEGEQ